LKVLICGGRDPDFSYGWFYNELNEVLEKEVPGGWYEEVVTIISGCARGVDTYAIDFANDLNLLLELYPADWDTHGKAAGYIRNKQMLDEGKPDLVIAFPGGKGTANMVSISKKAGVKVIEV